MLTLTSPHETRAHGWPAGAKLSGLLVFSLVIFALPGPVWAAAGLALAALGAWALGLGREWGAQLLRLWPLALVLMAWHLVTGDSRDGATVTFRMLAAVGAANLLTMTTRLTDLQALAERLARPLAWILPPRALALAFALVIRFVPVMLLRWEALSLAFRARSARRPGWRIAMPAVLAALDDAERVAEALRARGGAG